MIERSLPIRAAATLALAALFFTAPARADRDHDRDRERDYGFLADIDGDVRIRAVSYDGDVLRARQNQPIVPGDRIETGRKGRVEAILPGGILLYLDSRTRLTLASLADTLGWDRDETQFDLPRGRMALRIPRRAAEVRVDLYGASAYLAPGGLYFVEALDWDRLSVSVAEGDAEIVTDAGSEYVDRGESITSDDGDWSVTGFDRHWRRSDFDDWVEEKVKWRDSRRGRYLPERIAWASPIFEQYGSWSYVDELGVWGWRPRDGDYRPYVDGTWYVTPAGLTWMGNEPWGWVPSHYGSWTADRRGRWIWLPDGLYSPAWVYWYSDADYVGWAPVGYWDAWYDQERGSGGSFSFGFRTSWSGSTIRLSGSDLRPWSFLPMPDFSRLTPSISVSASIVPSARVGERRGVGMGSGTIIAQPLVVSPSKIRTGNDLIRAAGIGTVSRERRAVDLTQVFGKPTDSEKAPRALKEMVREASPDRQVGSLVDRMRRSAGAAPSVPTVAAPEPDVKTEGAHDEWRQRNRSETPHVPKRVDDGGPVKVHPIERTNPPDTGRPADPERHAKDEDRSREIVRRPFGGARPSTPIRPEGRPIEPKPMTSDEAPAPVERPAPPRRIERIDRNPVPPPTPEEARERENGKPRRIERGTLGAPRQPETSTPPPPLRIAETGSAANRARE